MTKKLAAWGALITVPTMIAGIYGMNFEHMPELELDRSAIRSRSR